MLLRPNRAGWQGLVCGRRLVPPGGRWRVPEDLALIGYRPKTQPRTTASARIRPSSSHHGKHHPGWSYANDEISRDLRHPRPVGVDPDAGNLDLSSGHVDHEEDHRADQTLEHEDLHRKEVCSGQDFEMGLEERRPGLPNPRRSSNSSSGWPGTLSGSNAKLPPKKGTSSFSHSSYIPKGGEVLTPLAPDHF